MKTTAYTFDSNEILGNFVQRLIAARCWFLVLALAGAATITQGYLTMRALRLVDNFLLVDNMRHYYRGRLDDTRPGELSRYCVEYAVCALLERDQGKLANQALFKQCFLGPAVRHAKKLLQLDREYFQTRKIRQTCKIEHASRVAVQTRSALYLVHGQLYRRGVFHNRDFSAELQFTLRLLLLRNPYRYRNNKLPYAVYRFSLATGLPEGGSPP